MANAVEQFKSRRIVKTADGVTVFRYYRCAFSDLTAGADGYTNAGIPAIGSTLTWTNATWSLHCTSPIVESVDLDPRSTAATAIIRVTARASRAWSDS